MYNGRERKGVVVDDAEELAEGIGGKIDWETPLIEARLG